MRGYRTYGNTDWQVNVAAMSFLIFATVLADVGTSATQTVLNQADIVATTQDTNSETQANRLDRPMAESALLSSIASGIQASGASASETARTRLNAYNINNILFVDGGKYATIQAAVDDLPKVNGKPAGTVYITNPTMIHAGQEVTIGPWTKLIFSPTNAVTYTGTGAAFTCDDVPTTYAGDGGIYGLDLKVTNKAGSGLNITECTWFKLSQVSIEGSGESSTGFPILIQNTKRWTEELDFDTVHVSNFHNAITFRDNCPKHAGCGSFAYGRWRHVVASPVGDRGTGYRLQDDCNVAGGDYDIQCLGGSWVVTCLSLTGTSSVDGIRLKIGGETPGPESVGISTEPGTKWQPNELVERWNGGTWKDSFRGTVIPYIYAVPGYGQLVGSPSGLCLGNTTNGFCETLDTTLLTAYRADKFPDASGTFVLDSAVQTLSNKTLTNPVINGTSITGTPASGNLVATVASGTLSITPGEAVGCVDKTTSAIGARPAMKVVVSAVSPQPNTIWAGYVSSAETVDVRVCTMAAGPSSAVSYNWSVIP